MAFLKIEKYYEGNWIVCMGMHYAFSVENHFCLVFADLYEVGEKRKGNFLYTSLLIDILPKIHLKADSAKTVLLTFQSYMCENVARLSKRL